MTQSTALLRWSKPTLPFQYYSCSRRYFYSLIFWTFWGKCLLVPILASWKSSNPRCLQNPGCRERHDLVHEEWDLMTLVFSDFSLWIKFFTVTSIHAVGSLWSPSCFSTNPIRTLALRTVMIFDKSNGAAYIPDRTFLEQRFRELCHRSTWSNFKMI